MIAYLVIAIVVIACLAALRWSVRLQGGPAQWCSLLSIDLRTGEVRVDGETVSRGERSDAADTRLHAARVRRSESVVVVEWLEGGADSYRPELCLVHDEQRPQGRTA